MHTDLTAYLDVAQVTLYAFWIFFACLIFYLRREDKREGYPLQYEDGARRSGVGFPSYPGLKNYLLRHGHVATLPNWKNDRSDAPVTPMAPWPGSPYVPTGNPLPDGAGARVALHADGQPDAGWRRSGVVRRPRGCP